MDAVFREHKFPVPVFSLTLLLLFILFLKAAIGVKQKTSANAV